ncbi:hypothetical protein ACJX0J_030066, partial [Zea mays]
MQMQAKYMYCIIQMQIVHEWKNILGGLCICINLYSSVVNNELLLNIGPSECGRHIGGSLEDFSWTQEAQKRTSDQYQGSSNGPCTLMGLTSRYAAAFINRLYILEEKSDSRMFGQEKIRLDYIYLILIGLLTPNTTTQQVTNCMGDKADSNPLQSILVKQLRTYAGIRDNFMTD